MYYIEYRKFTTGVKTKEIRKMYFKTSSIKLLNEKIAELNEYGRRDADFPEGQYRVEYGETEAPTYYGPATIKRLSQDGRAIIVKATVSEQRMPSGRFKKTWAQFRAFYAVD